MQLLGILEDAWRDYSEGTVYNVRHHGQTWKDTTLLSLLNSASIVFVSFPWHLILPAGLLFNFNFIFFNFSFRFVGSLGSIIVKCKDLRVIQLDIPGMEECLNIASSIEVKKKKKE